MILAAVLFLIGILIGLTYRYAAIGTASVVTAASMMSLWALRGEFGLFSLLVLVGYLLALQSGYLLGSYIALADDD